MTQFPTEDPLTKRRRDMIRQAGGVFDDQGRLFQGGNPTVENVSNGRQTVVDPEALTRAANERQFGMDFEVGRLRDEIRRDLQRSGVNELEIDGRVEQILKEDFNPLTGEPRVRRQPQADLSPEEEAARTARRMEALSRRREVSDAVVGRRTARLLRRNPELGQRRVDRLNQVRGRLGRPQIDPDTGQVQNFVQVDDISEVDTSDLATGTFIVTPLGQSQIRRSSEGEFVVPMEAGANGGLMPSPEQMLVGEFMDAYPTAVSAAERGSMIRQILESGSPFASELQKNITAIAEVRSRAAELPAGNRREADFDNEIDRLLRQQAGIVHSAHMEGLPGIDKAPTVLDDMRSGKIMPFGKGVLVREDDGGIKFFSTEDTSGGGDDRFKNVGKDIASEAERLASSGFEQGTRDDVTPTESDREQAFINVMEQRRLESMEQAALALGEGDFDRNRIRTGLLALADEIPSGSEVTALPESLDRKLFEFVISVTESSGRPAEEVAAAIFEALEIQR